MKVLGYTLYYNTQQHIELYQDGMLLMSRTFTSKIHNEVDSGLRIGEDMDENDSYD